MKKLFTITFEKNLLRVLKGHGDLPAFESAMRGEGEFSARYEMDHYQPLCIEVLPYGLYALPELFGKSPAVSVCHTFIQEGDLMRDPEIVFVPWIWKKTGGWMPIEITQDPVGNYDSALVTENREALRSNVITDILPLANMWARNLIDQGWHTNAARKAGFKGSIRKRLGINS